jgi:hypothetical protein
LRVHGSLLAPWIQHDVRSIPALSTMPEVGAKLWATCANRGELSICGAA